MRKSSQMLFRMGLSRGIDSLEDLRDLLGVHGL